MLSADTFAVTAAGQFGSGAGQFAVVQPAVTSSARWLLSIDSLPTRLPAGAAAQPAAGLPICSINLWVCIDTDVLSMSPSSPNPTSTVYVIYQSQQGRQATISTASGHSQPIADGVLNPDDLIDLYALAQGRDIGRVSDDEITIFKSVGASLEDFAAAELVYEQVKKERS